MITQQEIYAVERAQWQQRFEQMLDQVPMLVSTLREAIVPLAAVRLSERVSGGGRPAPLPFRGDHMEDADNLWAVLVEYVGEVAERLQEPAPAATGASWANQNGVQGLPAGTSADDAHRACWAVVAWLVDRGEKVQALGLEDSERFLFGLIRKLRTRYLDAPPLIRLAHNRICPTCGEKRVHVSWVEHDSGRAECGACGDAWEREIDAVKDAYDRRAMWAREDREEEAA